MTPIVAVLTGVATLACLRRLQPAPARSLYLSLGSGALAWLLLIRLDASLPRQLVIAVAVAGLTTVSVYDLAHHRLPNVFTLPAAAGTVVAVLIDGDPHVWRRALICGAATTAIYLVLWLAARGRGIGLGDVKLAPTIGILGGWISWTVALASLYLAVFAAAIVATTLLVSRAKTERPEEIAYGPFMVAGLFAAALIFG